MSRQKRGTHAVGNAAQTQIEARGLDLPFITEVVLAELTGLIRMAGDGPLLQPQSVPFFDNRDASPRFARID